MTSVTTVPARELSLEDCQQPLSNATIADFWHRVLAARMRLVAAGSKPTGRFAKLTEARLRELMADCSRGFVNFWTKRHAARGGACVRLGWARDGLGLYHGRLRVQFVGSGYFNPAPDNATEKLSLLGSNRSHPLDILMCEPEKLELTQRCSELMYVRFQVSLPLDVLFVTETPWFRVFANCKNYTERWAVQLPLCISPHTKFPMIVTAFPTFFTSFDNMLFVTSTTGNALAGQRNWQALGEFAVAVAYSVAAWWRWDPTSPAPAGPRIRVACDLRGSRYDSPVTIPLVPFHSGMEWYTHALRF